MRKLLAILLCVCPFVAQAAVIPPTIHVTETPNTEGGAYTLTIIQPPPELSPASRVVAWGITNQAATDVYTGITGWDAELISETDWDSGRTYETEPFSFEDPFHLFSTGTDGIGDFDSVFGIGQTQAAIYWVGQYFGVGIPATSSNFNWVGGAGNSTAFAIIQSGTESFSCAIEVLGESPGGTCSAIVSNVPLPAAAWLLGSALLGLVGLHRRRVSSF